MQKEHIGEIHLPSGEKVPVVGENERFWICRNSQFLKAKWELHKTDEEKRDEEVKDENNKKKQEKKGGKKK